VSISLLPIRISHFKRDRLIRKPKHSAVVEVERLRKLLAGAELLADGLRLQLDDQDHKHAETVRRIDERHGEVVEGLERQLAELQRRLDIACKAESAVAITQPIPVITPVLPLHQSPLAKTNPTHVPAWAVPDNEGVA